MRMCICLLKRTRKEKGGEGENSQQQKHIELKNWLIADIFRVYYPILIKFITIIIIIIYTYSFKYCSLCNCGRRGRALK